MALSGEQREELLRKLRSIAASAQDAQGYVDDMENLGELIDDMSESLAQVTKLAEKI